VFKLHTKNGVDHFLEACSREERDDWAGDITAAVGKLQTSEGVTAPKQPDPAGSQFHNIDLRSAVHTRLDPHRLLPRANVILLSPPHLSVSLPARCWTPCTTCTAASTWASTWSKATLTATASQVRRRSIASRLQLMAPHLETSWNASTFLMLQFGCDAGKINEDENNNYRWSSGT